MKINFTQQLLQSQLEMQEQTFNTISQEIHDNVGQILSLAKVQLNIIDQTETLDRALLSDARDSVSKAMIDLRDIAKSLNSERVLLLSLPEITGYELQRINRLGMMITSMRVEGWKKYRATKEAHHISNHSGSTCKTSSNTRKRKPSSVLFCYEMEHLKIRNYRMTALAFILILIISKRWLRIAHTIVNRAALIGGKGNALNSEPNEGTTITILTPYA